jgi:hypothetical protein
VRKTFEELNAEFAVSVLSKLDGVELTESERATAYQTCLASPSVLQLVGMYLVGSSERAESNLTKLKVELRRVFRLPEPEPQPKLITEPESELF